MHYLLCKSIPGPIKRRSAYNATVVCPGAVVGCSVTAGVNLGCQMLCVNCRCFERAKEMQKLGSQNSVSLEVICLLFTLVCVQSAKVDMPVV